MFCLPCMLHRTRDALNFSSLDFFTSCVILFSLPRSCRRFSYRNFRCDSLTGPRDWAPCSVLPGADLAALQAPLLAPCCFAKTASGLVSYSPEASCYSWTHLTSKLLCFCAFLVSSFLPSLYSFHLPSFLPHPLSFFFFPLFFFPPNS